jgi:hypothetical protein
MIYFWPSPNSCLIVIGLTGGVANRKSNVSTLLEASNNLIVDADLLHAKRSSLVPLPWLKQRQTFGKQVLFGDGTLDRKKLGSIIFTDEFQRKKLNAIVYFGCVLGYWTGEYKYRLMDIPCVLVSIEGGLWQLALLLSCIGMSVWFSWSLVWCWWKLKYYRRYNSGTCNRSSDPPHEPPHTSSTMPQKYDKAMEHDRQSGSKKISWFSSRLPLLRNEWIATELLIADGCSRTSDEAAERLGPWEMSVSQFFIRVGLSTLFDQYKLSSLICCS